MNKNMNGMVFIKEIPAMSRCEVYVVISKNQVLKFDSKSGEDAITNNIIRLKYGISTAPEYSLITSLPDGVMVSPTGALSSTSLKRLISQCDL